MFFIRKLNKQKNPDKYVPNPLKFREDKFTCVENFVGFKHKKCLVLVTFTSPKPIKAPTFFFRCFDRFLSVFKRKNGWLSSDSKFKKRRFTSVLNVRSVGFRRF